VVGFPQKKSIKNDDKKKSNMMAGIYSTPNCIHAGRKFEIAKQQERKICTKILVNKPKIIDLNEYLDFEWNIQTIISIFFS
jgi:hypothetical protein